MDRGQQVLVPYVKANTNVLDYRSKRRVAEPSYPDDGVMPIDNIYGENLTLRGH